MSWVYVEDLVHGTVVLSLEGTAVELFRARNPEAVRLHLALLQVEASGPDRKGRYEIRFRALTSGSGFFLTLDADGWARVHPVVEQVQAAQAALRG